MALTINLDDIRPVLSGPVDDARLQILVDDAVALALRVAPCLADTDDPNVLAAAKAIIRGALQRRHETGAGITTSQTAGPFQRSTETRGSMRLYLPSEEADLASLCSGTGQRRAFDIDTIGADGLAAHRPWCALRFLATYCSCGVDLTLEYPLWEDGYTP